MKKELDEAYRGMGIAYFEMEEFEKAIDAFGEALDNGAEETATLYNFIGISNMKSKIMRKRYLPLKRYVYGGLL